MLNRRLSAPELEKANNLLAAIRAQLGELRAGDGELLFAYRRKVSKELTYDERGKPMHRQRLKQLKWKEQNGLCSVCGQPLPASYSVLDRLNAVDGYSLRIPG